MSEIKNKQLHAVYNGNETIINAGFTMQSNFIVPMLSRMRNENILNEAAVPVIQTILSFKHTVDNPYPTRSTIARILGKSIDFVKKALKSISLSGVVLAMKAIDKKTGKAKRNSMYDFKPFFALLEKFIVEYNENKNYDVKISDLMETKVEVKKSGKEFPIITPAKEEVTASETPSTTPQDAPQAVEVEDGISLPEQLIKVCAVCRVDAEGIEAVTTAYAVHKEVVSIELFKEKIVAASKKKDFANYFNKCITNAILNNEQPTVSTKQQPTYSKAASTERLPEWFEDSKNKKEAKIAEKAAEKTVADGQQSVDEMRRQLLEELKVE